MSMITELKNKEVRVRKTHLCGWCGEDIDCGEKAQYRVYIFDGFTCEWHHPECYKAMCRSDDIPEEGYQPGMFERGKAEYESY